jgi:acetyl-CoA acetyltransferase
MYAFGNLDGARIVGVHTTEQGRGLQGTSSLELAMDAIEGALADAGMDLAEVDGMCSGVFHWPTGSGDIGGTNLAQPMFWTYQLGQPLRWHHMGYPGAISLMDCAAAISSGFCETVVIVSASALSSAPQGPDGFSWARPENEFSGYTGSYTAAQYALVARRVMHERGEDKWLRAMGQASATIRNFGHKNPAAVYSGRGPFTAQDVLDSRTIADPLTLLMCASINDGAAAVVLTGKDRAQDTPKRSVRLLGGASSWVYPNYIEAPTLDHIPDDGAFAREAWRRMGVSPREVDALELYDHFAPGVLLELEMYGFCERGTAADFVLDGGLELDGDLPTCTDGGNLSFSHNGLPGIIRVVEGVRQLRGEADDLCPDGRHTYDPATCRLVKDANVSFAAGPVAPSNNGDFCVFAGD